MVIFWLWVSHQVLIGPSDWEDHHLGKEGSEKYMIHNLPSSCSCLGLLSWSFGAKSIILLAPKMGGVLPSTM